MDAILQRPMPQQHEPQLLLHAYRTRLLQVWITLDQFEEVVDSGAVGYLLLRLLVLPLILQTLVLLIRDRRVHAEDFLVTHPHLLIVLHFADARVHDEV